MIKEIKNIDFMYNGMIEIDEYTLRKIKDYWNKVSKESNLLKESNILIMTNLKNSDGNYLVEIKESTFSHYLYSKNIIKDDLRCMFSGGYILTKDNFVALVSNYYIENEKQVEMLNLVGGMADTSDIKNGKFSYTNCICREFKEELGIELLEPHFSINLKYLKYLKYQDEVIAGPIGTIFEIKTDYTKHDLQELFKNNCHDSEIKEFTFFSRDNYKDVCKFKYRKAYIEKLFENIFRKKDY